MTLPAHRYKDRDAERLRKFAVGTPLARTLRRAHGAVSAQEPVSDVSTGSEGDSTPEDRVAANAPSTDSPSNWAVDIDGTIDAFPRVCQTLMSALTAAGHHVYVITGIEEDTVTAADKAAKADYLVSLGVSPECYHELIVLPLPHPELKAQALKDNDCGVLVDNNRENIRVAAAEGVVGLYLYNTREH